MSTFTTTEEAEQFLGRAWELLGEDPEVGPKLGSLEKVLGADYHDPQASIRIHCTGGTVRVERGTAGQPADVILIMASDTGHRFWQGSVNIPLALSKQEVSVDGKMSDVMLALPFLGPGYELYKQHLKDAGREDLLGR